MVSPTSTNKGRFTYKQASICVAVLLLICCFVYSEKYTLYPSFIHAWAQADRYALSLCFLENGFDFFHPCTFHYNVQFPSILPQVNERGITAVDFPLNEYIIALLMKITGTTSPVIFRLYTLTYSLVGLLFLVKLSFQLSKSYFMSFAVLGFAFFSPVYLYYQIGFLPSIPSLASLFIGLYYYVEYRETFFRRALYCSSAFLTLAALYRFPFVIFLLALILVHARSVVRMKKIVWQDWFSFGVSVAAVSGYFCYNTYLRKNYGSVFLGNAMPAQDWKEALELVLISLNNWGVHYFTYFHYFLFLFLLGCFFLLKRRPANENNATFVLLFLLTSAAGVVFYSVWMLQQFPDHDYYFLDTFYPLIVLGIVWLVSNIHVENKRLQRIYYAVVGVSIILLAASGVKTYKARTSTSLWDKVEVERANFTGADAFLDSIGIPRSAKMLVLGGHTSNMPFILMKRKGYRQLNTSDTLIKAALKNKFDYVVLQNSFMCNDIIAEYPEIVSRLKKIADNGKVSIYQKETSPNRTTILEFLGFSESSLKRKISINFDSVVTDAAVKNIGSITDSLYYSKPKAGLVESEYGLAIQLTDELLQVEHPVYCFFEGYFYSTVNTTNVSLVASVEDSGSQSIFYETFPLSKYVTKEKSWRKGSFGFQLPILKNGSKATIYIYNPSREKLYYDDLVLQIR